MIDGVHRRHDREQHLRRADVARGFLAADVLLARLQREAIGGPAGGSFETPTRRPGIWRLNCIARREERRVRSAVAERHAEALRAADGDVRAEFARRLRSVSASRSAATMTSAPASCAVSMNGA